MLRMLSAAWIAAAVVSSSAVAQVDIETVPVGDAGNAPDNRIMTTDGTSGYGAVGYGFRIGKFEVTCGQYAAFLNAVAQSDPQELYNPLQANPAFGSGITRAGAEGAYTYSVLPEFVDRPVNFVSCADAWRFANWLHNGQPVGQQSAATTEDGAYTLVGGFPTRRPSAKWALPTEDEWYKAALYKAGSRDAGYWLFPTSSDTPPGRDLSDADGNNANHYDGVGPFPIDGSIYSTIAGQFVNSPSPYGTYDQCGNLWEWNEAVIAEPGTTQRVYSGLRGASYMDADVFLQADYRYWYAPGQEYGNWGFRVVMLLCGADLDLDGFVDFADYLLFLNYYDAADPRVDFNKDGLVDFADYLEFLNLYGNSCEDD